MSLISRLFGKHKKRKTPPKTQRHSAQLRQEIVKRKIPSHELQIGMTVIDLDRPWTDLPFLFQEVTISTEKELDIFRRYCQHVYIDYTSLKVHREQQIANLRQQIRYKMETGSARQVQKSLKKELPRAKKAFDSSKEHIRQVMHQVQKDGHIDVAQSKLLVAECVSSILSNPSAMFWMTKIKDQDEYTAEHCLRVGILAITFGRHLQLAEEELHLLGMCGMLHDVGKMKIPNSIINKAGALTQEEFEIIKEHTVLGYVFLKEHGGIDEVVCSAAYNHHESLVGDGYPRQLDAAYLSVYDKIIAIVDSYDAMTSDRCYRQGMPPEKATAILYKQSNRRYDQYLVKEFIKMVGVYPVGSLVQLNNGYYAIVLSVNSDSKLAPVVELVADENKQPLKQKIALDLSKEEKYHGQILKVASSVSDTEVDLEIRNYITKTVAA